MAALLDRVGWHEAALAGHDIGGGVAQLMAIAGSVRVSRLILIDSIAYDSFPEPGIARLKEAVWDVILGAPDFDLARGCAKGLRRGILREHAGDEVLIDLYARPFSGVEGRLAYLRAARALRSSELLDHRRAIELIDTPTLLLWGSEEVFQPLDYARALAAAMRNARLELVDGAGHFLPEDRPDAVVRAKLNFLRPERKCDMT